MKIIRNKYEIVDNYVVIYLNSRNIKKELVTYIDLDEFDKVNSYDVSWHPEWQRKVNRYYAKACKYIGMENGKPKYQNYYLHRIIMNFPDNKMVDHLNHDTLDNRKYNLEIKSNQENSINRLSCNKNSISGERNVSWSKTEQRWLVQLQVNGKNKCFGRFKENELDKAVSLAQEKRKELYQII